MNKLILLAMTLLVFTLPAQAQTLRFGMINQDPDPVRAGDIVEVRFRVENTWEQTKYGVKVEILPEYPFSKYGESIRELGRLDGTRLGSGPTYFDFKLRVDPNAADGEHEIQLRVHDGLSITTLKEMFYIDVERKRIALVPYIIASNIVMADSKGTFTIEIANAGGIDVESLEMELLPSEDYRLLSTSNYIYLGDVEADDTEAEDFDIYVDKGITEVHIPVRLRYVIDDHEHTNDTALVLNLLTKEEAKKIGLVKQSSWPYVAGAAVIAIVAILLIRRRRRS